MADPIYTESAEADLVSIWQWIAQFDESAADRIIEAMREKARFYVEFPGAGGPRDDLRPGLRSFVVERYVVFYRPVADSIEILRVLHGSRDIDSLMQNDQ